MGRTMLIYATAFGHKDVVNFLLGQKEVHVNAHDDTHKTALMHASRLSTKGPAFVEIARMLINAKAVHDAQDHHGKTALMLALSIGGNDVASALIAAGSSVNLGDSEGHVPLDWSWKVSSAVAKQLRDAGAQPKRHAEPAAGYANEAVSTQAAYAHAPLPPLPPVPQLPPGDDVED